MRFSQVAHFAEEIALLESGKDLPRGSILLSLHPFVDPHGVLRVGGREQNSQQSYAQMHPMILHGKHLLAKLIIQSEHQRQLHAGPMLVSSTVARRFHILSMGKTVHSVTRQSVTCCRRSIRPIPQKMGQLPIDTPGAVFEKVGVDDAGPLQVKYRMPMVVVFLSPQVKAVHLEAVHVPVQPSSLLYEGLLLVVGT